MCGALDACVQGFMAKNLSVTRRVSEMASLSGPRSAGPHCSGCQRVGRADGATRTWRSGALERGLQLFMFWREGRVVPAGGRSSAPSLTPKRPHAHNGALHLTPYTQHAACPQRRTLLTAPVMVSRCL
jgi:hypothetical protein